MEKTPENINSREHEEYIIKSILYWEQVERDAQTQVDYARRQLDLIQKQLEMEKNNE